jgi:hypothetical protein
MEGPYHHVQAIPAGGEDEARQFANRIEFPELGR